MHNDVYESIHVDDMGPVIGSFMQTDIHSFDPITSVVRLASDARVRIGLSSGSSIPAEVLPGEEICADNIIRRKTTAEAVGYDEFHKIAIVIPANSRKVPIEVARVLAAAGENILWAPEGTAPGVEQFALVIDELAVNEGDITGDGWDGIDSATWGGVSGGFGEVNEAVGL